MNEQNVVSPHNYSALKRNAVLIQAAVRMNLENIVKQNSQTRFYLYEISRIGKLIQTKNRLEVIGAGGNGE